MKNAMLMENKIIARLFGELIQQETMSKTVPIINNINAINLPFLKVIFFIATTSLYYLFYLKKL